MPMKTSLSLIALVRNNGPEANREHTAAVLDSVPLHERFDHQQPTPGKKTMLRTPTVYSICAVLTGSIFLMESSGLAVSPPPQATSAEVGQPTCTPLSIDPTSGRPQSSPRVYSAARRFFLDHTAPGSRHALGPELARERPSLRFLNTARRETGQVMQETVKEIVSRYPDSFIAKAERPLRVSACYDEVYLDLTEDGSYWVIVETATARPVFMYWRRYQP